MAKLPLGGRKFTAKLPDYERWRPRDAQTLSLIDVDYFYSLVSSVREIKEIKYFCSSGDTDPKKFEKEFKDIEPHLLVYYDPKPAQPRFDNSDVDLASARAGVRLLKTLGYTDSKAFNADLLSDYGTYTIPFDIDAAIKDLTEYNLDITVTLTYAHVELTHPKILPHVAIILSLPDELTIRARKLAKCTETGVVPVKDDSFWGSVLISEIIPAKTKSAWDARKVVRKGEVADKNARIKELREQIEQIEAEIEAAKPKSD